MAGSIRSDNPQSGFELTTFNAECSTTQLPVSPAELGSPTVCRCSLRLKKRQTVCFCLPVCLPAGVIAWVSRGQRRSSHPCRPPQVWGWPVAGGWSPPVGEGDRLGVLLCRSREPAPDGQGVRRGTHGGTRPARQCCGRRPSLCAGGSATERWTRAPVTCRPNAALR